MAINDRNCELFVWHSAILEIYSEFFGSSDLGPVRKCAGEAYKHTAFTELLTIYEDAYNFISDKIKRAEKRVDELPLGPVQTQQVGYIRLSAEQVQSTDDGLVLREGDKQMRFPCTPAVRDSIYHMWVVDSTDREIISAVGKLNSQGSDSGKEEEKLFRSAEQMFISLKPAAHRLRESLLFFEASS